MTYIIVTQDAEALAKIHATSFDDSWSALFFSAMLNQPGVIALSVGQDTARGFILVRIAVDEAEILTLAVAPEYRNQKLGRALVDAALVLLMAQRASRCFLEVAEDNIAALAVYTACGFTHCGLRKDYYQRGPTKINAILMERLLQK